MPAMLSHHACVTGPRPRTAPMTRLQALTKHLSDHDCEVVREGGSHTVWQHRSSGRRSTVPRHRDLPRTTARAICKQLGVPPVE
jgi:mRNA interferase HicA